MRTIFTIKGPDDKLHVFTFNSSPLIEQEEQIEKVMQKEGLESYKLISWQYFNAIELSPETRTKALFQTEVKAFFETKTGAEQIATFHSEEIYNTCLPCLEKQAKQEGKKLTESIITK